MASPLFPLLQKFVEDEWVKLQARQITPWAFFNSHVGKICVDFHGAEIGSGGLEFSGSIRDRFWRGYIEPFLEDITCRAFEYARRVAAERHQRLAPALRETGGMLISLTRRAYSRMAEIDQRLRGKGNPESVPRYSPEVELADMERFIVRHLNAELATLGVLRQVEDTYKRYPLVFKVIGLVIAFAAGGLLTWALIPSSAGNLRGANILERVPR
jgi:hypothetical protein